MKLAGDRTILERLWLSEGSLSGPWRTKYLGSFSFRPSNLTTSTTYEFDDPWSQLGLRTEGMVIAIRSNWGHPDFTCVYRIRAHGSP